jgi:hypothetical protein
MSRCHSRRLSSLHQPRRSMWPLRFRRLLTCSFAPKPAGSIPRTPLLLDSSWCCCRAWLRSRRAARPDGFPPVRSCSSRTPTGQAIPPVFLRTAWSQSLSCGLGCAATTLLSTRSRPSGIQLSRTECPSLARRANTIAGAEHHQRRAAGRARSGRRSKRWAVRSGGAPNADSVALTVGPGALAHTAQE